MANAIDDEGDRTFQLPTDEVLTRITDAVFALNRDWEFTYVNLKAEELLHRSAQELLGETVWDAFPDAVGSAFESQYERAMETQSSVSFEEYYPPLEAWFEVRAYPSESGLSVFFTSITEERSRLENLKKYQRIVEAVDDGIFTIDVTGTFVDVNEAYTELTGYSREELVNEIPPFLMDDETIREFIRIQEALLWGDEDSATMAADIRTADGDRVATETTLTPVFLDGEPRTIGVVRDLSDRARHQRRLKLLHEATREVMEATTKDEIAETIVETTREILGLPGVAIYQWDEEDGCLSPWFHSQDIYELFDDLPTFEGGRSLAWDAFIENELRVYNDVKNEGERYNPDTVIESELFAPLGDHGILISGSTQPDFYESTHVDLVSILVADATVALDRADRQRRLTERQDELERQNRRLLELTRINNVVRNVQNVLVDSATRQEAEERICENLAAVEPYCLAWIGSTDRDRSVQPRTWSGENGDFLDHVQENGATDAKPRSPAQRAVEIGAPVVVDSVFHDESFPRWRKAALERGLQSAISLPLVGAGTGHDVVEIYASESHAFEDKKADVFFELCETIADGIEMIERRRTMASTNDVEIELRSTNSGSSLARVARELDVNLRIDSATLRDDGTWLLYVSTDECDSRTLQSAFEDLAVVDEVRHIRTDSDGEFFGLTITEFETGRVLTEFGATLKEFSVSAETVVLELRVGHDANVRALVDAYRTILSDVALVRRELSAEQSDGEPQRASLDSLTERQCEVLRMAYDEGYFEWPRETSGQELADALGISNPVFHRHLRRALQKQVTSQLGE